ncbi:hypothetical protein [Larkinella soli]|uniref:hypothetical protein n=1 Tax=Larkinella soli TaxID=1770527 RepID=UPI000FFC0E35|nr:hypothetical protein [Larkinella soli]
MNGSFQLHRQRDFGQKVNTAFQYIVRHYRSLGLAILAIAGPLALATSIATRIFQTGLVDSLVHRRYSRTGLGGWGVLSFSYTAPSFWAILFFTLLNNLLVAMVVYRHLLSYEERPDEPITVKGIWSWLEVDFLQVFLTSVASFVLVLAGALFLFVPGIYLAVVLSLGTIVVMREDLSAGEAIRRCFELVRGHWWETGGLLLVMLLIQIVLSNGIGIPLGLLTAGTARIHPVLFILSQSLLILIRSLVSAPLHMAIALHYFHLLDLKEGTGLLDDIESIGTRAHSDTASQEDVTT